MEDYKVMYLDHRGHGGHTWTSWKIRHEQMNAGLDFEAEQGFIVQE